MFAFDYDQLISNVKAKKAETGWTWNRIATWTGIPAPTLSYYMLSVNRPPETKAIQMTGNHIIRLMMWIGDYDIREYLIEGEKNVQG